MVGSRHISETLPHVSSALFSKPVFLSVIVRLCLYYRRLYSVCGCGEKQQLGHTVPAGPQELSQRGSMDSWMESSSRLPAVPKLPELVKGAATQSG